MRPRVKCGYPDPTVILTTIKVSNTFGARNGHFCDLQTMLERQKKTEFSMLTMLKNDENFEGKTHRNASIN